MSSNQLILFDQEIWRWVAEHQDLYKVSNLGRVMSCYFGKAKILKPAAGSNNYLHVVLCKDKKQKTRHVHDLVAQAFLGPCPGKRGGRAGCWTVDHIDENSFNNRAENLRWLEHEKNVGRAQAGKNYRDKLTKSQVILIRKDTRHNSVIAAEYGVKTKTIWNIKKYRTWKKV